MRSSNPLQRESVYEQAYALSEHPMTASGTAGKLFLLSLVMLAGAYMMYSQFMHGNFEFVNSVMKYSMPVWIGLIVLIAFKPNWTPFLAPVFAFSQGAAVSGMSCYAEAAYKGIVMQAGALTMLTVLVMSVLFKTGVIKASEKLRSVLFAAGITIGIFYFISHIMMLTGMNVPYFTHNTPLNIGINIVIAGIAALSLILDFDFIEQGVSRGAPALYEWYGAFSLLVTIIWLYIEILRLLMRFKDR